MANITKNRTWIILLLVLVLGACGRKEAPQIISDDQPPQLVDFRYELKDMVLKLEFKLSGNPEGVGYQIDRAAIDPYCKCPGLWRRYLEHLATPRNIGVPITKLLRLRSTTTEYVFRIRAFDAAGQLGPWSKNIHTLGVDPYHQ